MSVAKVRSVNNLSAKYEVTGIVIHSSFFSLQHITWNADFLVISTPWHRKKLTATSDELDPESANKIAVVKHRIGLIFIS